MRVCIIIPMHNEEAIAERSIKMIAPYLDTFPHATTLCVVDDGSSDQTPVILDRMSTLLPNDRFHWIRHPENRGYGAALRTGTRFAIDGGYEYALFMDSDLTNHPRYLTLFYEKMNEGWDVIKASRYILGGGVIGVPRFKQYVSRIGNYIARWCYRVPVRDCTNGFRAVRTSFLWAMDLRELGFPIIMEELAAARALGARFCEIPYTLTSRREDEGASHLSYGFKMWGQYLKYAWQSPSLTRSHNITQ